MFSQRKIPCSPALTLDSTGTQEPQPCRPASHPWEEAIVPPVTFNFHRNLLGVPLKEVK